MVNWELLLKWLVISNEKRIVTSFIYRASLVLYYPKKIKTSNTTMFFGEASTYPIEVSPDVNWKNGNISENSSPVP